MIGQNGRTPLRSSVDVLGRGERRAEPLHRVAPQLDQQPGLLGVLDTLGDGDQLERPSSSNVDLTSARARSDSAMSPG
ncbi:MAG: hypothetical protein R2697_19690 [Ilumatobacteraceae bacterium]